MRRIIDALTGVFASSAEAPGAHTPSARRAPVKTVAPPHTRTTCCVAIRTVTPP